MKSKPALKKVLKDVGPLLHAFRLWLQQQCCEELLLFFEAVNLFRTVPKQQKGACFNEIYEKFLRPGCDFELNLSSDQLREISKVSKEDCPSVDIFMEMQHSVYVDLQNECFPKFLSSESFQSWSVSEDQLCLQTRKREKLEDFFWEKIP